MRVTHRDRDRMESSDPCRQGQDANWNDRGQRQQPRPAGAARGAERAHAGYRRACDTVRLHVPRDTARATSAPTHMARSSRRTRGRSSARSPWASEPHSGQFRKARVTPIVCPCCWDPASSSVSFSSPFCIFYSRCPVAPLRPTRSWVSCWSLCHTAWY